MSFNAGYSINRVVDVPCSLVRLLSPPCVLCQPDHNILELRAQYYLHGYRCHWASFASLCFACSSFSPQGAGLQYPFAPERDVRDPQ